MPFYDYECRRCGPFTGSRPMAESAEPMDCPGCGRSSGRVFLVAPAVAGMDADRRMAISVNERSAHEPKSSSRHGAGCSCCSTPGLRSKPGQRTPTPAAAKSFPSARPWMISH